MKSLPSLGSTKFHIINLPSRNQQNSLFAFNHIFHPKHRNSCIEWAVQKTAEGCCHYFLSNWPRPRNRRGWLERFVFNVFFFSQGKCWYPWDGTLDNQPHIHLTYSRPVFIGSTIPGNTTIIPLCFFCWGVVALLRKLVNIWAFCSLKIEIWKDFLHK